MRARLLSFICWLGFTITVTGCHRTPPDLREWRASDHDQADEQNPSRAAPNRAAPATSANTAVALIEVAWKAQCTPCHGPIGRGDGPQGPLLHAPNLTAAEWQSKVTDEQIRAAILNGKNRMPKFDLPAEVVTGLVARIRASKGK